MQMFADHSFFAWLIVMTIPAFLLGVFEKPIKYYGMFASLVFLWLALGHNTVFADLADLLFCLLEFTVMPDLSANPARRKRTQTGPVSGYSC